MSAVRRMLALAVVIGAAVAPAAAAPTPQLVVVEVEHTAAGYKLQSQKLVQATAEPGGLEVPATATDWIALGFKAGDRIVTQNGSPVGESVHIRDGIYMFELIRANKHVVLELVVHPATRLSRTIDEAQFDRLIDMLARPEVRSTPVKNASGISGVRVVDTLLALRLEVDVGDVIHTVDGQPIKSDDELTAAIRNLRVGTTDIELQRLGRAVTLSVIRKAPLDLKGVKQLSPTKFEVSRAFADAVIADYSILSRKLESTPFIKAGQTRGVTVYNVATDSPAAVLGILNGDVVLDIDGRPFDTISDIIDLTSDLQGASSVAVHLERKGKPMTVTYVVK